MFRELQIPKKTPRAIFLHSMPGRYEDLPNVFSEIQKRQINLIVSLTPLDEIQKKSPTYAKAIETNTLPCERKLFSIPDFEIPVDAQAFTEFVKEVADHVNSGDRILIHCAGGIGRTGTFAVCLLKALGLQLNDAIESVSAGGSGPETTPHQRFVAEFQPSSTSKISAPPPEAV